MAKPTLYTVEQTKVGAYQNERRGRRGIAVAFVDQRGREFAFALSDGLAVKLRNDLTKAARELGLFA